MTQPDWCNYCEADNPIYGCWSLCSGLVTNENYCKNCDCYKSKNNKL
jgi:hypothetical protein